MPVVKERVHMREDQDARCLGKASEMSTTTRSEEQIGQSDPQRSQHREPQSRRAERVLRELVLYLELRIRKRSH